MQLTRNIQVFKHLGRTSGHGELPGGLEDAGGGAELLEIGPAGDEAGTDNTEDEIDEVVDDTGGTTTEFEYQEFEYQGGEAGAEDEDSGGACDDCWGGGEEAVGGGGEEDLGGGETGGLQSKLMP
jgi:hypothetical protein